MGRSAEVQKTLESHAHPSSQCLLPKAGAWELGRLGGGSSATCWPFELRGFQAGWVYQGSFSFVLQFSTSLRQGR